MTVDGLFRELQKLKLDGHGDKTVLICDMTNMPPYPAILDHVRYVEKSDKVILHGESVEQMIATLNKNKQNKANGSNC